MGETDAVWRGLLIQGRTRREKLLKRLSGSRMVVLKTLD